MIRSHVPCSEAGKGSQKSLSFFDGNHNSSQHNGEVFLQPQCKGGLEVRQITILTRVHCIYNVQPQILKTMYDTT